MAFFGVVLFLGLLGFGIFRGLTFNRNQYKEISGVSFNPIRAAGWLAAAFAVLFVGMSFTVVDAGQVGVVKRWGQPVRQINPGAHLLLPFAEEVSPVPVQTRVIKPNEDAASKDLQIVHTEITLAYHVDPAYATSILVQLNNDAEGRVISPAILEAIKAVTARYDVQELISNRSQVRDGIEEFVRDRLAPYHIIAETTSITNFSFSQQYEQAIEAKVTAMQRAEQAQNELNKVKIDSQQQVALAVADASARVARAEAEAKELKLKREQLSPEIIQLRTIEKWDGQLPQFIVGGGSVPMLDVLKAAEKARAKN